MAYSDQADKLRIELDTKHCTLSGDEIQDLERALDPLRKPIEKFPVAALYVTIEFYERSNDYRVKTALRLPGTSLVTGDLDKAYLPAFERCVRKLLHKVLAHEGQLGGDEARAKLAKGTRQDAAPDLPVEDIEEVRRAVEQNDYATFRDRLLMYEEPLRKRIGRWIQRYPLLNAQLGERFSLADAVEEVFLNAFERFDDWPQAVPLSTWLEHLIDPSLKILSTDTIKELEAISFARSLRKEE